MSNPKIVPNPMRYESTVVGKTHRYRVLSEWAQWPDTVDGCSVICCAADAQDNLYVSLRDYPSGFYQQSIKGVMRNIVHCRKLLESAMALEQSEWERALDLSGIPSEQFRSVAPQLKEGLALLREKPQLLLTWQTPKERGRYASMPYVLVMAREPAIDRRRLLLAVNPQDGRIVLALSFCNDLPFLEALEMAEGA